MKTNIHFLSYLVHFFLEWEMFQTKGVEKTKIHFLCMVNIFRKIVPFMRKWGKILQNGAGYRQYSACVLHAGYVRLQIHTLRLCNTHCFSTATIAARTRLKVTLHGIVCPVFPLKPNECSMYRRVSHQKRWILTIQCIYAFHTILTLNNDRVPTDNDRTFFLIETLMFFVRYKTSYTYYFQFSTG